MIGTHLSATRFGRAALAMSAIATEELVAELCSALVCADLGITPVRDDHADYLASWLDAQKSESQAIFHAVAHAERAVNFVADLTPRT